MYIDPMQQGSTTMTLKSTQDTIEEFFLSSSFQLLLYVTMHYTIHIFINSFQE